MASLVVGLVGLKRSGKDTFAQRLIEEHGFTRVAFADPLKEAIVGTNPLVRVEADEVGPLYRAGCYVPTGSTVRLAFLVDEVGWEVAKEIREVRRLLQEHGVSIRDAVDPDVWINAAKRRVDATPGPVVITDVRFPNELDYIDEHPNGFAVRIIRPGQEANDLHVSEVALVDAEVDEEVLNDGTVADLHVKADRAAWSLSHWI